MGKLASTNNKMMFARWFGQVAPNQTENQTSKDGVGIRVRVRILYSSLPNGEGVHSVNAKTRNEDLPLAIVQMPTTFGYGNRLDTGLIGGESVCGYFLNGNIREPVIDGVLPRTMSSNQITASEAKTAGTTYGKRINPYSQNVKTSSPTNRAGGSPPNSPAKPSAKETGLKSFLK